MLQLRWKLEYRNRPAKVGRWNDLDAPKELMSAFAPKDGISEAQIEAMLPNGSIKKVGGCPGHEWESFQVLAAASVPGFVKGEVRPMTSFIGMILYTNDEKAFFIIDGRSWVEKRNDKNIVFEGWRN